MSIKKGNRSPEDQRSLRLSLQTEVWRRSVWPLPNQSFQTSLGTLDDDVPWERGKMVWWVKVHGGRGRGGLFFIESRKEWRKKRERTFSRCQKLPDTKHFLEIRTRRLSHENKCRVPCFFFQGYIFSRNQESKKRSLEAQGSDPEADWRLEGSREGLLIMGCSFRGSPDVAEIPQDSWGVWYDLTDSVLGLTMQPLFGSRRGSSGDQFRAILFFGTDNVILPFLESIVWPNWKYHRCGNKVPGRRLIWNSPFSNLSRRSLFQFGARRNSYLQYPRTRDVCVAFRLSHFQRPLKYSLPLCLLSHLVQIFNKAFPSRCYHWNVEEAIPKKWLSTIF